MFLLWNRFPWASCYDRNSFYYGGFVTSFGVPLHRKSSFGFGIFHSILTFCGYRMIIPLYIYILLGILIMNSIMLYINILYIIYCIYIFNMLTISMSRGDTYSVVRRNFSSIRLLSHNISTSYNLRSIHANNKIFIPYIYASMHSNALSNIPDKFVYVKSLNALIVYVKPKNTIIVYLKPDNNIIVYVKPLDSFKNHEPLMPNITVEILPPSKELAVSVLKTRSGKWKNPYSSSTNANGWIVLDSSNKEQMSIRLNIIKEKKNNVIRVMPDADLACRELFHYVFIYMHTKYPLEINVYQRNNFYYINCYTTNRSYLISDLATHDTTDLFRILSECVISDFTIMKKINDKYVVIASNSLFSINWEVSDRIGFDIVKLHGKAPGWQEGQVYYKQNVEFFGRIRNDTIFKRATLFIVNTSRLNLPIHTVRTPSIFEIIRLAEGYRLKDLYVRREHQTFHLLPVSGLIVFNVRTFSHSLDEFTLDEIRDILKRVYSWNKQTADYHGRDSWLPVIEYWIIRRYALYPVPNALFLLLITLLIYLVY